MTQPMASEVLDTSGFVIVPMAGHDDPVHVRWSDLTPFAQGYVEAMFASCAPGWRTLPASRFAFSDLAPEALARIMADCERARATYTTMQDTLSEGREFWGSRGVDVYPDFLPLHPFLSDDGRVCLRPASETQNGAV